MAEKDITCKKLLSLPDIFADAANLALFDGLPFIKPGDLEPVPTISETSVLSDGKMHELARDIAFKHVSTGTVLALIGCENQSDIKHDMILRILGYDGASYQEQVTAHRNNSSFKYYPVITFVLNYSSTPWNAPTTLHEFFELSVTHPYWSLVGDYKMHVLDVGHLPPEKLDSLQSDLRFFATVLTKAYGGMIDESKLLAEHVLQHEAEIGLTLEAYMDTVSGVIAEMKGEPIMEKLEWLASVLCEERFKKAEQVGVQKGRQEATQEVTESAIQAMMHYFHITREEASRVLSAGVSNQKSGISSMNLGQ